MVKVGIIVISYCADPQPLFASIVQTRHEVRWYIFVHGRDSCLRSQLDVFSNTNNSRYFPYAVNRGLARSWNEGVLASLGDGNDVTLIVNDDLFFFHGAFDQFVEFILAARDGVPDFGAIMTYGMEPEGAAHGMRQVLSYGACFALGPGAVDKVGCFDENYWPAYREDSDYFYRLVLAGAPLLRDERPLLQHQRSSTVRLDRMISLLHDERMRRNEEYYMRKWGGRPEEETFATPFNDRSLDIFIPVERRGAPYGPKYDRRDLAAAETSGFLEGSLSEELLALVQRHEARMRRCLEWSGGRATAVIAEYAHSKGAELVLSIGDVADRPRLTKAGPPKYPFLHLRILEDDNSTSISNVERIDIPYIAYPLDLGVKFDTIIVAGRWRIECALAASRIVTPDGLVILLDRSRDRRQGTRAAFADRSAASVAALGRWARHREGALHAVYDPVEETGEFLVLRPKLQKGRARRPQENPA